MNNYKYLLFDLDRTLWDFEGNAEITFRKMYAQFLLEELCKVDYQTFHDYYRIVNDQLWEGYRNGTILKEVLNLQRFSIPLEHFGVKEQVGRLSAQLGDFYVHEGPKQKGLMPGARELLDYLSDKTYRLCIITNGFSEAQLPKMKSSDIYRYFSHFYLSENIGYMKPNPKFFEGVLQQLSQHYGHEVLPEECLVIGDDYKVDIEGAHSAHIPQVFYNYNAKFKGEYSFRPTYEIHQLIQLKEIL